MAKSSSKAKPIALLVTNSRELNIESGHPLTRLYWSLPIQDTLSRREVNRLRLILEETRQKSKKLSSIYFFLYSNGTIFL